MDDQNLMDQISKLVEEERTLRTGAKLDEIGQKRMAELEARLDQLWDLLRRREAREEFHQDPDLEREQPVAVVENYIQ